LPAAGNVTVVAAAFAVPNVTPLGPLVALHVYVSVDVDESSVAEPDKFAVVTGISIV
jgi:hypothetical protein